MGNDDYNEYDDSRDDHTPDHMDSARDGHAGHSGAEPDHYSDGFLRPALADVDETAASGDPAGRWVTHGGVVAWQAPDDADDSEDAPLLDDARSAWASENIALPLGAPASARVRAVRAWLGLRRVRETELMGELLLERRRLAGPASDDDEGADTQSEGRQSSAPERSQNPHHPLALALAEAQAAADEYETLLGLLEETRAHVGVQSALVEFYLAIGERLAALAAHPLAPEGFAEQALFARVERQPASGEFSPAARSEWEGRAGAALATRKRVEQVTAAEPEDD